MIYFYPHAYLRDRQLDLINNWPPEEVCNPEVTKGRVGAQVSKTKALSKRNLISWKQCLPLLNIKLRPKAAGIGSAVYVWGGLIASGRFIVALDNPWSLVGYNVRAMGLYKWVIKKILLSNRCIEIRCISKACRDSLLELFGREVYTKASVHYPISGITPISSPKVVDSQCKFLFVGSQFRIKGGYELLKAFL